MMRVTASFALSVVFVGCNSTPPHTFVPTRSSPVSQVATVPEFNFVPPPANVIRVGEELRDTFVGSYLTYELTPPSTGTLVARLTWDQSLTSTSLMLTIGDTSFRASAPGEASLVGRMSVTAGQKYQARIEEGRSPWDYYFNNPFVLITSIERSTP
jgi:hypothetical protein